MELPEQGIDQAADIDTDNVDNMSDIYQGDSSDNEDECLRQLFNTCDAVVSAMNRTPTDFLTAECLPTCPECGESFSREQHLETHLHNRECSEGASSAQKQESNEATQSETSRLQPDVNLSPVQDCRSESPSAKPRPHTCPVCAKSFVRKQHMYRHLKNHQRQKDTTAVNPVKLFKTTADCETVHSAQNPDCGSTDFGSNPPFSSTHSRPRPVPCQLFQNAVNTPPSNPVPGMLVSHSGPNLPSSELVPESTPGSPVPCVIVSHPSTSAGPRIHNSPKARRYSHACPECGRLFVRKQHVKQHLRIHKREKDTSASNPTYSKVKPSTFPNPVHTVIVPQPSSAIGSHKYLKLNLYSCPVCSNIFAIRQKLLKHLRTHRGQNDSTQLPDPVQNISFDASQFDVEQWLHSCLFCGKHFTRKDHLQRHLQIHQKDTYASDFVSSHSNIQRSDSDHSPTDAPHPKAKGLRRMKRSKSTFRRHVCPECGQCFSREQNMRRHYREVHDGDADLSNVQNSPRFIAEPLEYESVDSKLNAPPRSSIPSAPRPLQQHVCPVCLNVFTRKHHLQRHLLIHQRQRDATNPEVKSVHSEAGHQPRDADLNPPHSETVRQYKSISSAPKPRPHVCPVCGKCFVQKHHLQRHCLLHNRQKDGTTSTVTTAGPSVSSPVHFPTNPLPSPSAVCAASTLPRGRSAAALRMRTFSCPDCAKNFTRKHHVVRHLEIHKRQKGSDGTQSVPSDV